jgi:hypothetical protein
MKLRQQKYLNNIVEQDHRFIKKRTRSMLGFKCVDTAISILSGVEAMHMIKKEQIDLRNQSVQNQKKFIYQLFGLLRKKKMSNLCEFCCFVVFLVIES